MDRRSFDEAVEVDELKFALQMPGTLRPPVARARGPLGVGNVADFPPSGRGPNRRRSAWAGTGDGGRGPWGGRML